MKQLALIVILVACHRPDAPETKPDLPAVAPVTPLDQTTAMARWRELAPTGTSMYDVVEKIPEVQRAAMAFALVRDGHMKCTRMATECGQSFVDGPADAEGLDAPCLRRRLVEYMLANEKRIAVPADVRTAIAAVRDDDLIKAIANRLDDKAIVDFLVEAEAAGTPAAWGVLMGRPHEVIVDAARRHVDAAISELSTYDEHDRDLVIAAIADTQIDADTRADILIDFHPPSSKPLLVALEAAVREPNCRLSGRASELLAAFGDKRWLPHPPAKHDPEAYFHEVCRLRGGSFFGEDGQTLAAQFAPKGILLVAPRGEPYSLEGTKPVRRLVTAEDDLISILGDLQRSRCTAKTCVDDATRYELTWAGNVLSRVTVHRDLAKEKIEQDKADAAECNAGGGD